MSDGDILRLLLIILGMFLMPFISKKLKIPSAVGEILYGIAIRNTLSLTWHNSIVVNFLSLFGFIVLMYMAGLELDIKALKHITKKDAFVFALYFVVIIMFGFLMTKELEKPIIFVLVFCVTSIGLLYPVLKEQNMINKPFGLKVLILGSIGEIISLFAIIIFNLYFKFGFSVESFVKIVQLGVFIVLSILFLKLLKLFLWWFPHLSEIFLKTGNTTETGIRTNFLNLIVFVFLSNVLGIEPILGAFISGLILSLSLQENENIKTSFGIIGNGFLVPIFFIHVGLSFDLSAMMSLNMIKDACLVVIIIVLIRYLSSFVLLFSDFKAKEVLIAPMGTSFPLTLLVAVSQFGKSFGVLDDKSASMLVLSAMLASIVYPNIFKSISAPLCKC
ncbi:putative NA+/H+ antiporter (napA) [Desulfurella amilsii]|uniref:Putative NA+/H+ antiporter (NapA) n=1 Tax=Desulfurella amilsii TaxID=1562698 RepID=A0A1X4XX68_9BACT|nr:cation:proton antiporter [Desulfurella amilsii]OSS42131.1 putative NA+/H+ antiporter (napA) [Desulfurella amilsii]